MENEFEALTSSTPGTELLEDKKKAVNQKIKRLDKIVMPIEVAIDVDSWDETKINSAVEQIQKNIQNAVQKQLALNPIKLPIAFASAITNKDLQNETEENIANELKGTSS